MCCRAGAALQRPRRTNLLLPAAPSLGGDWWPPVGLATDGNAPWGPASRYVTEGVVPSKLARRSLQVALCIPPSGDPLQTQAHWRLTGSLPEGVPRHTAAKPHSPPLRSGTASLSQPQHVKRSIDGARAQTLSSQSCKFTFSSRHQNPQGTAGTCACFC